MADEKKEVSTRLNVVRLSDVQPEEVSWLWKPYLPIGKVTLLEGDPESGKSYLSLAIAAHVTLGEGLPAFGTAPSEKRQPRNVMLLTGEDGTADTVLPRLLKVGGDAARVFQLRGIVQTKDEKDFEISVTLDAVQHIEAALKEYQPELVVVDPFQSFLGSHLDMHRANEVRPVLDGLAKLAAKYGCAIVLIRHLKKDTSGGANYRGLGSIDIYAAARSVLLAGKNPLPPTVKEMLTTEHSGKLKDEKTRCVFAQTKCSLAKSGPSIAYAIEESGLTLDGPVTVTADDILQIVPKLTQREDITEWLTKHLSDGSKTSKELKQAGATKGFSERQLDKAAERLGVDRKPGGFGKGWLWSLPAPEQAEPAA
jgi:putative DNA primase/helicase